MSAQGVRDELQAELPLLPAGGQGQEEDSQPQESGLQYHRVGCTSLTEIRDVYKLQKPHMGDRSTSRKWADNSTESTALYHCNLPLHSTTSLPVAVHSHDYMVRNQQDGYPYFNLYFFLFENIQNHQFFW